MISKLLTGQFAHTMDAKGRVKMPSLWENALGKSFMVTRGTGTMLFVFSMEQWEIFTQRLMALPMMDKKAQALRRIFGGGAWACETDKQGRFLIPQHLRKHAQLEKDIVLTGAFNWGEIWNADQWNDYNDEYSDAASEGFMELFDGAAEQFEL